MYNKAYRKSHDIYAMYVTMTIVLFKVNIQVLLIIILIKSKFLSNYWFYFNHSVSSSVSTKDLHYSQQNK